MTLLVQTTVFGYFVLCTEYFLAILFFVQATFLSLYSTDSVCLWSRVYVTILFPSPNPLPQWVLRKYVSFMTFMPQPWQLDFQVRITPAGGSERDTLFVYSPTLWYTTITYKWTQSRSKSYISRTYHPFWKWPSKHVYTTAQTRSKFPVVRLLLCQLQKYGSTFLAVL